MLNWANYPEAEQSWQPRENLMCDSLLDAYNNKRAEKIEDEQQNITGEIDDLRDNVKALGDLVTKRIQKSHIDEDRKQDKQTNKCELCDQMFASAFSLKRHNASYHSETSTKTPKTKSTKEHLFKCNECKESFRTNEVLNKHNSRKHADPQQAKLLCKHCTKEFVSVYNLKDHMRRMHRQPTSTTTSSTSTTLN